MQHSCAALPSCCALVCKPGRGVHDNMQFCVTTLCMQMGDHGVSGQHKYQLEEAQRAEKRVSLIV